MSITGGWLISAIILARPVLKKAPANLICFLWLIAGLRLSWPGHIESSFSLLPDTDRMTAAFYPSDGSHLSSAFQTAGTKKDADAGRRPIAADQSSPLPASPGSSGVTVPETDRMKQTGGHSSGNGSSSGLLSIFPSDGSLSGSFIHTAEYIWLAGLAAMCAHLLYGCYRIQILVSTAIPDEADGSKFYRCGGISSPFLYGTAAPRIYVPFSVPKTELRYILKHEQAHKSRLDHLVRPVWYLLLACYWFHPLVWAAWILSGRDMELACDEKVIRELGSGCKKAYCSALVSCAAGHKTIAAFPVAFGEIGVKKRVIKILNYKKPGRWTLAASVAVCTVIAVCFATEAKSSHAPQQKLLQNQSVRTAGTDGSRSPGNTASDGDTTENIRIIQKYLAKWAQSFCNRDKSALDKMLKGPGKKNAFGEALSPDSHSFGWSSPWPWGGKSVQNYRVSYTGGDAATILYYAWTSDPHVTVWHQELHFRYDADTEEFYVIPSCLKNNGGIQYLDNISTKKEFDAAYPDGTGFLMDYLTNGAGKSLNRNARDHGKYYRMLFQPDTAAVFLMNITPDTSSVKAETSRTNNRTFVTFTFMDTGRSCRVEMIQPYGKNGIWIPQFTDS